VEAVDVGEWTTTKNRGYSPVFCCEVTFEEKSFVFNEIK
jgi:hypothetical protein